MWDGYQWLAFQWALVALTAVTIFTRLYINLRGIRKVRWYRDCLVTLSWLCFVGLVTLNQVNLDYHYYDLDGEAFMALPLNVIVTQLKVGLSAILLNGPPIFFCKFDLLFLFHELAPRAHNPKIFKFMCVAWFFTIIGFIIQVLYPLLNCMPFSKNFDINYNPSLDCGSMWAYYSSLWSTHVFSDLLIYVIPAVIIGRMQNRSLTEKLSAGVMFLIGAINIAAATFSWFPLMFWQTVSWDLYGAAYFVTFLQQATALWVVCGPQIRSMYKLLRGINDKKFADVEKGQVVYPDGEGPDRTPSDAGLSGASDPGADAAQSKVGWFKGFRVTTTARAVSRDGT